MKDHTNKNLQGEAINVGIIINSNIFHITNDSI